MTPSIWICPNVDADFIAIFQHPDQYPWLWSLLRESGGGWKFHHAHLEPGWHSDQRPPLVTGHEQLRDVGAFEFLKNNLVSCAGELPIIKSWDKTGDRCRDIGRIVFDAVKAAGGAYGTTFGDEPYTWSTGGAWVKPDPFYLLANGTPNYALVDAFWATYVRELKDYGVYAIELTESTPNNPPAFFVDRIKALKDLNALPDGFLWDGFASGMREASQQMKALGVSRVGAIVGPSGDPRETSADFCRFMLQNNQQALKYGQGDVFDNIQAESWHCKTSEGKARKEGTVLLPLPNMADMLPTLKTIAQQWGVQV